MANYTLKENPTLYDIFLYENKRVKPSIMPLSYIHIDSVDLKKNTCVINNKTIAIAELFEYVKKGTVYISNPSVLKNWVGFKEQKTKKPSRPTEPLSKSLNIRKYNEALNQYKILYEEVKRGIRSYIGENWYDNYCANDRLNVYRSIEVLNEGISSGEWHILPAMSQRQKAEAFRQFFHLNYYLKCFPESPSINLQIEMSYLVNKDICNNSPYGDFEIILLFDIAVYQVSVSIMKNGATQLISQYPLIQRKNKRDYAVGIFRDILRNIK